MAVGQQNTSRGLSVRQLTFIFLGAVGVCAMFFALGFLVGSNGRSHNTASPALEQVPPPSEIPPTVNPPAQDSSSKTDAANPVSNNSSSVVEQDLKPAAPALSQPASRASSSENTAAPANPHATGPEPKQAEERSSGSVMVQVAAIRTERGARSLVKTLQGRGFHARLLTPHEARAHDHLYRVQVGPFTSRDQALPALKKLSREGFKPFIKE